MSFIDKSSQVINDKGHNTNVKVSIIFMKHYFNRWSKVKGYTSNTWFHIPLSY